ncbi:MAG: hypothetical protein CBC35_10370 [Planctomycetes bacterium TMED75]|nr:hypothetical protein [Planctomycetaceae bacterium]OUU91054.1 MAG: hypothetical protein CBC35_10370 [Planctomycetes bacterium TMED75]
MRQLSLLPLLLMLASLTLLLPACGKREDPTAGLNTPAAPAPTSTASAPTAPPIPGATGSVAAATSAPTDPSSWTTSTREDPANLARCAGLVFDKPALWPWMAPSMRFRTLQYSVPGSGGSPSAELIFSVFIGSDGGGIQMNLNRWIQQFRPTDGVPARVEQSTKTINDMAISYVELEGSYAGMGAAAPKPNWAQLGAIIQAPGRTVYVRLLGPDKTVLENVSSFESLVDSVREGVSG